MKKNFYITCPLYYPNAKPHIGTAYTTIITDVISRYKRINGYNVVFTAGLDEHGQKIEQSAIINNMTPQEWVDHMSKNFLSLWQLLNISYDRFIRTTDADHYEVVKNILKRSYENEDIYLGEYKGKYSVSEETYVTDSQLENGLYMGKPVIEISEPTYYFKLSKYQDKLLKLYEESNKIYPDNRKNEIISFIKQGLHDLSISRTTFKWGLPIEFDKDHVVYVWFDALNGYLTAAGYGKNEFKDTWENATVCHVLGKDILRFHAIIWPAILMSAGVKLPDHLIAHGWWTSEGQKMSKSLGNVIDPIKECNDYGVDRFRYYLIREGNFNQDSDYSRSNFIHRLNSDLSNDLGNLIQRTLSMISKHFGEEFQVNNIEKYSTENSEDLYKTYKSILDNYHKYFSEYNLSEAIKEVFKYISRLNKYIDETKIWILIKDENTKELAKKVLYDLLDGIYKVSHLIYPVMPETANKILSFICINEKFENINSSDRFNKTHSLDFNVRINKNFEALFPRIEVKEEEFKKDLIIENEIYKEDFDKVQISVVKILSAENIENTTYLKLIIDTGIEKRQVISNIYKTYKNVDELINKNCLAVLNLTPITIANHISQAMILTTKEKKKNKIITVNEEIKIGTKII